MNLSGGWKNRIKSTIHTNSRIDALLNDSRRLSISAAASRHSLARIIEDSNDDLKPEAVTFRNRGYGTWSEVNEAFKQTINVEEMKRIIEETTQHQLQKEAFFRTYNPQISNKFSQILSRRILERTKDICTKR